MVIAQWELSIVVQGGTQRCMNTRRVKRRRLGSARKTVKIQTLATSIIAKENNVKWQSLQSGKDTPGGLGEWPCPSALILFMNAVSVTVNRRLLLSPMGMLNHVNLSSWNRTTARLRTKQHSVCLIYYEGKIYEKLIRIGQSKKVFCTVFLVDWRHQCDNVTTRRRNIIAMRSNRTKWCSSTNPETF